MSRSPQRRKQTGPAKGRKQTFKIIVEAQPMIVSYEARGLNSTCAHFEFRSPHKQARRIPVSQTGYRSVFVSPEEVRAARGPQAFARAYVLAMLDGERKRCADPLQLALFR